MKNNENQERLAKEYVQELAQDIMLSLTDEEIESILGVEHNIRKKFEKVTKIDTDNVTPIFFPLETPHQFLRSDETSYVVDHQMVLDNAPSVEGDFITITKVVK